MDNTHSRVHRGAPMPSRAAVVAACLAVLSVASADTGPAAAQQDTARIERGRYLTEIGLCNDCHTHGYAERDGEIPEAQWLTGTTTGYRGPWGTTYPANLRALLSSMTEDEWVGFARNLRTRPPMPWFVLSRMSDDDLRAIHHFVRFLGPSDASVPGYLPPGQTPEPPFVDFVMSPDPSR